MFLNSKWQRGLKWQLFVGLGVMIIAGCGPKISIVNSNGKNEVESIAEENISKEVDKKYKFKYDLEKPDVTCRLGKSLLEISALSYDESKENLLAVNDEKAMVYRLNARTGDVLSKFDFGDKGDYEGIEIVGDKVYVLKANGDVFETEVGSDKPAKKYKSPLTAQNDVEGLGYNPLTNKLILACKGSPNIEGHVKLKSTKAFYSFDLKSKTLDPTPAFSISDESLFSFFDKLPKRKKSVSREKKLLSRLKSFSPSGIAYHPIEKVYYIISSVGKLLLVVDEKGKTHSINFLEEDLFLQPEGICIAKNGDLFISNEGRSLVANILKFGRR